MMLPCHIAHCFQLHCTSTYDRHCSLVVRLPGC
jgi:hypothetical protein